MLSIYKITDNEIVRMVVGMRQKLSYFKSAKGGVSIIELLSTRKQHEITPNNTKLIGAA